MLRLLPHSKTNNWFSIQKNWTTLKLTTVKLSNVWLIKTAPLTYAKSKISLPIVML
ncbi:Uncharacterised protein [Vibrio cholerae]|nr:Uncharacterised protein [Vibrio cholerae]